MKFQVSPAPGRRRIIHRVKLTGALKAPTESSPGFSRGDEPTPIDRRPERARRVRVRRLESGRPLQGRGNSLRYPPRLKPGLESGASFRGRPGGNSHALDCGKNCLPNPPNRQFFQSFQPHQIVQIVEIVQLMFQVRGS